MGIRFRRSIRILPFFRLNLGRRAASVSVGVRGAHVTFGRTGTRTTVGQPGSGLSYTHLEKPHQAHQEGHGEAQVPAAERHVSLAKLLVLIALVALLMYFIPSP